MKIYLSADHGGFELKQLIVTWLQQSTSEVEDLGPFELDPDDDYPPFAFNLAERVVSEPHSIGILVCRSGNGMAIAANKVKGARAALCFGVEHAVKAKQHDHANILVLDADYLPTDMHRQIVEAFLTTQPEYGGRHERRVTTINEYEQD